MSSEPVISAAQVGKTFRSYAKPHHRLAELFAPSSGKTWGRSFQALTDVDFEVFKGETVGILGRNGSGKSTLLQIICGIMEPTNGDIRVTGRIAALLELGAGFNPEFTGRENVRLYAGVLGLDSTTIERKLPAIIEFADIGHFIDEPVKHYSSGMFVRLAFSVAIHVEPEILIIDEALSVGDEAFQRKCFSRIEEIKRMGATILFVSHSASTILQLCDRAMVLHGGQRIYFGKPNSAVAIYQRIIYAAPERIGDLIEQAVLLDRAGEDWESEDVQEKEPSKNTERIDDLDVERFDPGIVSQSKVEFERQGACIIEPRVTNSLGETVNVLKHGEAYRYEFEVVFEKHASHVHFGMLVKSVTGVELAGASSHRFDESVGDVAAGHRVKVCFHWRCDLLPGMYFLNAGCNGVVSMDAGETFLHRIVDAFAFRVEIAERPRRTAGFFNILTAPFVELENLED